MTKNKLDAKMIITELLKQKIDLEEQNKQLKERLYNYERRLATCQK